MNQLVVEATGPADVRTALTWARERDMPLAVQATGHGTRGSAEGALLLKTSRMTTVLVDPYRQVARVGPGARWADVMVAAAPLGLAPLSGTHQSVGVTGYTLGGGFSLLSRKYGFAADSLLRADVITADGTAVTASPRRNADLFWALRGGGGNFGVVTALEFRLYPVTEVYAGVARFPAEAAAETIARYRDWAATAPDELSTGIILDQGPTFTIKSLFLGSAADFHRIIRPLWTVEPVSVDLRAMPYAGVMPPGIPPANFGLYKAMPDAVIEHLTAANPAVSGVEIKHWGGALGHPATDPGPAGHRAAQFSIAVNGPAESVAPIRPYATGSFLNFLHDPAEVETAYTPENYRRLREIKSGYDPDNVFGLNLNIPPAHRGAAVAAAR